MVWSNTEPNFQKGVVNLIIELRQDPDSSNETMKKEHYSKDETGTVNGITLYQWLHLASLFFSYLPKTIPTECVTNDNSGTRN